MTSNRNSIDLRRKDRSILYQLSGRHVVDDSTIDGIIHAVLAISGSVLRSSSKEVTAASTSRDKPGRTKEVLLD